MNAWIKVVTSPLGLAGFALFLVFGLASRMKFKDERRWWSRLAASLAAIALVAGLLLSYFRTSELRNRPPAQQQTNQVHQTTSGQGSPAVQGVQGDVSITIDQSSGTPDPQTPAAPQAPKQKKAKQP